ncbi:hypothetical protein NIES3974_18340 [Calothrix sp. NIES-3974]|nr:hypothetical protein NIES3974_18340 [Calothrix sp. NIES-3974]
MQIELFVAKTLQNGLRIMECKILLRVIDFEDGTHTQPIYLRHSHVRQTHR